MNSNQENPLQTQPLPETTTADPTLFDSASQWVSARVDDLVESRIQRRLQYWRDRDERPFPHEVPQVGRRAGRLNAAVSGAATLVSGPAGAFTLPAELVFTLHRNVDLVVDAAVAYRQEDLLDARTVGALAFVDGPGLLGRLQGGANATVGSTVAAVGRRYAVRRVLRSAFGRVVPVVGAVGVAWWVNRHAHEVARRAQSFFESTAASTQEEDRDLVDVKPLELVRPAPVEAEVDDHTPAEVQDSEPVLQARYALARAVLRSFSRPTKAQQRAFDERVRPWASAGLIIEDAADVLASEEELDLDLIALAGVRAEAFEDIALVSDGKRLRASLADTLASSFGISREELHSELERASEAA